MVSLVACWKLEILPRGALVLPNGKDFTRNAAEHFAQVSISARFT
jgi:hypothetical protein